MSTLPVKKLNVITAPVPTYFVVPWRLRLYKKPKCTVYVQRACGKMSCAPVYFV